jgi:hypothetical protein
VKTTKKATSETLTKNTGTTATTTKTTKGPFGVVDDHPINTPDGLDDGVVPHSAPLFQFDGAPTDLMRAMEKAFVLKKKAAAPRPKRVVLPEPGKVVKVRINKNVGGTQPKPAQPASTPRTPHPMGADRHTTASGATIAAFDRNRDGATESELKRAAHLITNVTKVEPALQKRYAESLQSFTRDLTEFLLVEIAPYESALDSALDDAADMVSLITGSQNVSFSLGRADTLLRRLPELKTLDWVCNRLDIPDDIRELVVNEYMGTNNEHRKAKKESGANGISAAKLSQLQAILGLQRRRKGPQPQVPPSSARTKR